MSFNEAFLSKVTNDEYEVQKALNQILRTHKQERRRKSTESSVIFTNNGRSGSMDSQYSVASETSVGVPLISIPTSEFCSLNMRLLERNNEVKLAMVTASRAEAKLMEYKKTADEMISRLKDELHSSGRASTTTSYDAEASHGSECERLEEENAMLQEHNKLLTTQLDQTNAQITHYQQELIHKDKAIQELEHTPKQTHVIEEQQ
eukprot:92464_1